MSFPSRYIAARIINQVTEGHSLTECLSKELEKIHDHRDAAFIQAMCYGVCRYYDRLDVMLSYLLQKPMQAKDTDVHALLLVGLYQLSEMRVAPHAGVSETVNATEKLKKPWARGFVNAVLREYLRLKEEIDKKIMKDPEAQFSHPAWLISAIKKAWPHQWEDILSANNAHPPFSLRVNSQRVSREEYLKQLPAARSIPETKSGIVLDEPVSVEALPGFNEGLLSVQDGAAQLAAELLALAPNQRVLDACAAPGGKLTHILEIELNLSVCLAVEKDAKRMQSIQENLTRLHLQATCINADAMDLNAWWDEQLFDRILLDAPCSASGVIRRHPDIKLLRQPKDIEAFAKVQLRLLNALWLTLKPGGRLIYATCSIFPEENVDVVRKFLESHSDAIEHPIIADWGVQSAHGRQILPGMHGMDGFYYACLERSV